MLKRFALFAILGFALAASLQCVSAAEVVITKDGHGGDWEETAGEVYIFSTGEPVKYTDQSLTIEVEDTGKVFVGKKDSHSDPVSDLTLSMGAITMLGPNASLTVGGPGCATSLSLTNLQMTDGGTVELTAGATGVNKLIVDTLDARLATAERTFTLGDNTDLYIEKVNNGGLIGHADFNLNGGKIAIGTNNVTLANGTIHVNATNDTNNTGTYFSVGSSLTVGSDGSNSAETGITVASGEHFFLVDSKGNKAALKLINGAITLEGNDEDTSASVGALTLGDGSVFNGVGKVNATSLTVSSAFGKAFVDAADVATLIAGNTVVKKDSLYYVAGDNNEYRGDILVESLGVFADRDDPGYSLGAEITVGSSGKQSQITLDGGSLQSNNGFKVTNAAGAGSSTVFIKDGTGNPTAASLDARGGLLDLSGSHIKVYVNNPTTKTVHINSESGIRALSYTQLNGTVVNTTNGSVADKMVISGTGTVGGGNSAAIYEATDSDTQFVAGLTVGSNGVIRGGDTGDGTITLGKGDYTNPVNGSLTLAGSATLDAQTKGKLTFVNGAGNAKGTAIASGKNNSVYGDVVAEGFNARVALDGELTVAGGDDITNLTDPAGHGFQVQSMTVQGVLTLGHDGTGGIFGGTAAGGRVDTVDGLVVASTGVLQAKHANSYLRNNGTGDLKVDRGGLFSAASADVTAAGYGKTVINGIYEAGYDAVTGDATKLTTDSDITIGKNGIVSITNELAQNAEVGDVILATTDGALVNNANKGITSIFGQFGFDVQSDGGSGNNMIISAVKNQIDGQGSDEDRRKALENLRDIWGEKQINSDLGNIIYDASVRPPLMEIRPLDSVVGQKNLDLLSAIGNPDGRNVSRNTVEYVNGALFYGPTDIAIETSRAFASDVNLRTKAIRCQFVAQREAGSMDALATMAMNSELLNRFWAGGFGYWLDADDKDTFSGYKYDGYGLILGYDRVVAPGLAMGVSAAYMDGDYEDKGAIANNSKIESFTAGLYATYSNDCGWFATGNLAYTYSDNRLSDLRNDPTTDDRSNSWTENKYRTSTWNLGLSGGYDFRPSECFTITPQIGINYVHASNSDHNSLFGGLATQRAKGIKNHGLFLPADLTVMYDWHLANDAKLRFEASAAYAYNLRESGLKGHIDYFDLIDQNDNTPRAKVASRDNSRHNYKFGGAVRYKLAQWDFALKYDYYGRADSTAHRVLATACIAF